MLTWILLWTWGKPRDQYIQYEANVSRSYWSPNSCAYLFFLIKYCLFLTLTKNDLSMLEKTIPAQPDGVKRFDLMKPNGLKWVFSKVKKWHCSFQKQHLLTLEGKTLGLVSNCFTYIFFKTLHCKQSYIKNNISNGRILIWKGCSPLSIYACHKVSNVSCIWHNLSSFHRVTISTQLYFLQEAHRWETRHPHFETNLGQFGWIASRTNNYCLAGIAQWLSIEPWKRRSGSHFWLGHMWGLWALTQVRGLQVAAN